MLQFKSFFDLLATSKISVLGAVLVTTAIGADAMLIIGELLIFESNPYIGIVAYVIFPGAAAFGLMLIPIGILLRIRKLKRDPVGALVRKVSRKNVFRLIFTLTMVNFVVFAFFGYRSIHFMESAEFCGQVCHEVMSPEYTVYQRSPHSEIHCVDCHVGSGVGYLIKSKLDGTRQLAGVVLDNYARPIETPIHNMRPANEVCGVCHSPESYQGERVKLIERYDNDEANTRSYTVLNMRLGDADEQGEIQGGVHWHSNEDQQMRYFSSDERREHVVRVELSTKDGQTRVWTRPDSDHESTTGEHEAPRVMDCVDCHNRAAHVYIPEDQALNDSLADGRIDADIPWIRMLAEELITKPYESNEEALAGIAELPKIYQQRYPEYWTEFGDAVQGVVPILQDIHTTYVYPNMKIAWNTYPSLLGHPTPHTSACFRCHGGTLVDEQGLQITNDCRACHYVLAEDEQDPMILRMLKDD
jgi:hypothetical protein